MSSSRSKLIMSLIEPEQEVQECVGEERKQVIEEEEEEEKTYTEMIPVKVHDTEEFSILNLLYGEPPEQEYPRQGTEINFAPSRPLSPTSSSSSSSSTTSSSSSSCESDDESNENSSFKPDSASQESSTDTTDSEDILENLVNSTHSIPSSSRDVQVENISIDAINSSQLSEQSLVSSSGHDSMIFVSPLKKGKKRRKHVTEWSANLRKTRRNQGLEYLTCKKKLRMERKVKSPCSEKCRLKCSSKFDQAERETIFNEYWKLGDLNKQRNYISKSMAIVEPKYKYIRVGGVRKNRKANRSFYILKGNEKIQVCKTFFQNTLDITDRVIRTVKEKENKQAGKVLVEDSRGKHSNHQKVSPEIVNGIKTFIDIIPKIESHYLRANSSRHFIEGGKTISDLYRDYVAQCQAKQNEHSSFAMFYKVFTNDYNISFFTPKKDQCSFCTAYNNTNGDEKVNLEEGYAAHQKEKELSRAEKAADKSTADDTIVAVYDLQAVVQLPKGDISVFYYSCKLNVLNFTIYNLKNNKCDCFIWDESNGNRGVNELGSCVLNYCKKFEDTQSQRDIIFYSDNCCGQQKNKFMVILYIYILQNFNFKSITHKFLVTGHTQNEGDSAHSLIERCLKQKLKSGPMYTTESFVDVVKCSRKRGEPFSTNALTYDDFFDIKKLATNLGITKLNLKINDVRVIKVSKDNPNVIYFKNSFAETEFQNAKISMKKIKKVELQPAFISKPGISERKKADLIGLVDKNIIPKYYHSFYNNL